MMLPYDVPAYSWGMGGLVNAYDGAYIVELLEVVADDLDVVHVVYAEAYGALKESIIGLDEYALHIHIELLRDDIGNLVYYTHTIDTLYTQRHREVQQLMGAPLSRYDTVSVGRLEFGRMRTFTLVDNDLSIVINESQHIITWNRMTTISHTITALQGLIGKDKRTLLVYILCINDRLGSLLLFLAGTEETAEDIAR